MTNPTTTPAPSGGTPAKTGVRHRTHYLYLAVIAAVVAGAVLGILAPRSPSNSSRSARRSWASSG